MIDVAPRRPVAIKTGEKERYYIRRDGSNRMMRQEDFARMVDEATNEASVASINTPPF